MEPHPIVCPPASNQSSGNLQQNAISIRELRLPAAGGRVVSCLAPLWGSQPVFLCFIYLFIFFLAIIVVPGMQTVRRAHERGGPRGSGRSCFIATMGVGYVDFFFVFSRYLASEAI